MLDTVGNIATIFLVIEGLMILIVLAVLSFGLAKAMMVVRHKTMEVMPQIQGQARRLADTSETASQKIASPFIRLDTAQARFRGMRQRVFTRGQHAAGRQRQTTQEE